MCILKLCDRRGCCGEWLCSVKKRHQEPLELGFILYGAVPNQGSRCHLSGNLTHRISCSANYMHPEAVPSLSERSPVGVLLDTVQQSSSKRSLWHSSMDLEGIPTRARASRQPDGRPAGPLQAPGSHRTLSGSLTAACGLFHWRLVF